MIYSIGHDIVENKRISEILNRYGSRGLKRILTVAELAIFERRDDKVKFLAKRLPLKKLLLRRVGQGCVHRFYSPG